MKIFHYIPLAKHPLIHIIQSPFAHNYSVGFSLMANKGIENLFQHKTYERAAVSKV